MRPLNLGLLACNVGLILQLSLCSRCFLSLLPRFGLGFLFGLFSSGDL